MLYLRMANLGTNIRIIKLLCIILFPVMEMKASSGCEAVSCVEISRSEYYAAKYSARRNNVDIIRNPDISKELLCMMLGKIAAGDSSGYVDKSIISSFKNGLYVWDDEFVIEAKSVAEHPEICILCFATPIDAYSYFFFMDESDSCVLSPIKIPSRFIALSDEGVLAGVHENNDAWYTKIDFFRINNFNTSGARSITQIGQYDSLSDKTYRWSIPYDEAIADPFWYGGCLFLAGYMHHVELGNQYSESTDDVFFKIRCGLRD